VCARLVAPPRPVTSIADPTCQMKTIAWDGLLGFHTNRTLIAARHFRIRDVFFLRWICGVFKLPRARQACPSEFGKDLLRRDLLVRSVAGLIDPLYRPSDCLRNPPIMHGS